MPANPLPVGDIAALHEFAVRRAVVRHFDVKRQRAARRAVAAIVNLPEDFVAEVEIVARDVDRFLRHEPHEFRRARLDRVRLP